MDKSAINPYIRVATRSVLRKGAVIFRRIIFDYELIFVEDGEFTLTYDDVPYLCQKGQFILIRPGIPHSFSVPHTDLSQPHIHFDVTHAPDSRYVPVCFKDREALTREERACIREDVFRQYPRVPFVTFAEYPAAVDLFYTIVDHPKSGSLTQKGLLIQLIDRLTADNFPHVLEEPAESRYGVEEQVKAYLDAGQGTASDLSDVAKQFNYSKCHLEHRFKERYGISLMAYRNERRMQAARRLLAEKSVSEVAEELGFSSIYVFSRAFKKHVGRPPTAFRKSE